MGLNDIHQFKPEEKIIEYVMAEKTKKKRLVALSIKDFMNETASETPAPGGGSVSAYIGALGIALGTMVANLSSHKRGWDESWKEFSDWAEKGKQIQNSLLQLVDDDTDAFNKIMEAYTLPKKTEEEKLLRNLAIQDATKIAIMVPFKVMEKAYSGFGLIKEMVEKGNPNSITDAGVGALAIRSCIRGAFLNVRINASGLKDEEFVNELLAAGEDLETKTIATEEEILNIINLKIRNM
jgi:glutamate formiminotransferase/formiminotetrahydrofolate cyclodeaminase